MDETTRYISLQSGQGAQVVLQMADEFSGKFTVRGLDPLNTLRELAKIEIETDYLE